MYAELYQTIRIASEQKEQHPEYGAFCYRLGFFCKKTGDKEKALANINTYIKLEEEKGNKIRFY